jgi:hypothetical protein
MKMTVLTPENDTRNRPTESLISEWAEKLYKATARQDYALRGHLKRRMPQGLRGPILIREAEIALSAGDANRAT